MEKVASDIEKLLAKKRKALDVGIFYYYTVSAGVEFSFVLFMLVCIYIQSMFILGLSNDSFLDN